MHHAHIDKFAYQDSPIHRLDSRVKFIATVVFTAMVISLPRHGVSILACYAVGPFAMLVLGKVPLRFAFRHILIVSPFIAVLALTCVFYEKAPVSVHFGPFTWQIAAGWLRAAGILAKFTVTMMALIALVSTTPISSLLAGLERLKVPRILIVQLGFLYRYIFLLIDRAQHILRARAGRKLRNLGIKTEIKTASSMIGSLLISSIDSAERVNIAMQARGFDGKFRTLRPIKINRADYIFAAIAVILLTVLYCLRFLNASSG